jgi:glycosyltransferase involved in cell wall biosynthesis
MKIAIFHDYFGAIGGGERVALQMAKILGADVITTDTDVVRRIDPTVRVISLGKTIKLPPLKQISASWRFASCDFSDDYDFFIFSGNWAPHAARRHHPNLWYCFTPVRAFYDLYTTFLSRQDLLTRQAFRLWVRAHRGFDQVSIRNIDRIIAISQNVRARIQRYHGRDAEVIYPPVDVRKYRCIEYGDFWLSVNRLYPEKRIELQIEAFRAMPEERLLIVGGYARGDHATRYADRLFTNLPPNITIRGEVGEEDLSDLYAHCRGHLCTSMDEDYGLTPLEAMASGKPVVAVREGGYLETVTDETGILVEARVDQIMDAVRSIGKDPSRYRIACEKRAGDFSCEHFRDRLKGAITAGDFPPAS